MSSRNKKNNPIALYGHCGTHASNLFIGKTIAKSILMIDALDAVNEVGKLYDVSGKFKTLYLNLHETEGTATKPGALKPICPT